MLVSQKQYEVFPVHETYDEPSAVLRTSITGVESYDADNLYPQRYQLLRQSSPQADSSLSLFFDYLFGFGFDDNVDSVIVNRAGGTLYDVLHQIVKDYVQFRSFALLFQYNLNLEKTEVTAVEFKNVRMAKRTSQGVVPFYYVSDDWHHARRLDQLTRYYKYLPSPVDVAHQIEHAGGIDRYPGQLWYYTPEKDRYPLSTFDAVTPSVIADAYTQKYKANTAKNGFSSTHVFKDPQVYEDSDAGRSKRDNTRDMLRSMRGPQDGIIWMKVGPNKDLLEAKLFEKIDHADQDEKHKYTEQTAKENIIDHFKQPRALFSRFSGNALNQSAEIFEQGSRQYTRVCSRDVKRIERGLAEMRSGFTLLDNLDLTLESYHESIFADAENGSGTPDAGNPTPAEVPSGRASGAAA